MPRHDYKCGTCGRIQQDVDAKELPQTTYCCGHYMDKVPSAPAFVIGGYNASNGYSKGKK